MKRIFPPIGISHTTENIEDLYKDKLKGKTQLVFHPAAQPNSYPHLGTLTTLISTFALAKRLKDRLKVDPLILFWELENAPGEMKYINNETYYKTLDKSDDSGSSKSEKHLVEFRKILNVFSNISGINYKTWSYLEFQNISEVRKIILELIELENKIAPLICPSDKKFKVRFACPVCHFANKNGGKLIKKEEDGARLYGFTCPDHGPYHGLLAEYNNQLFDINTPVRALAREIYYIRKMKMLNGHNMMSDGADWIHYAHLNMEALLKYGIKIEDFPSRFFAPVIQDCYGAKLAKSVQVGSNAYSGLPKYNIDSTYLEKEFSFEVYKTLWNEVSSWLEDPKKIFRNYSILHFQELLNGTDNL